MLQRARGARAGFADVGQQAAQRAQRQRVIGQAAGLGRAAEAAHDRARRGQRREQLGAAPRGRGARRQQVVDGSSGSSRTSAGPMRTSSAASVLVGVRPVDAGDQQLAGADVDVGQPEAGAVAAAGSAGNCCASRSAGRFRAACPGVSTRTISRGTMPLRVTRADLLGDGDVDALARSGGAMYAVGGVRRDAGHGHALAAAHLARGQRYVEDARGQVGVVLERLVEVAQPKQQDARPAGAA